MIRFLAFLLMALVWGLTWLPVKVAAAEVPPILLAAVRFILAGLCFLAWSLAARLPLGTRQPLRLAATVLLITACCYGFLFWGVARAPSGISAVVNLGLMPVFTIIIGALYGEERITARRLGAIALGVAGLALLFSNRDQSGGVSMVPGLAAVVAATLSYAWGAIVSRPLLREMPPVALAFWQTFLGGLILLLVSFIVEGFDPGRALALAHGAPLAGLAFLVVCGSLIGFSIYLWLMRDWGAFRAGLYCFLSPIVAVAAGTAWAGERFDWPEAVGMAVMLAATALALGGTPARTSVTA